MKDCIFCKIVKGEIPSKKVLESEDVVSFYDISPAADTHILIVPKKHIETFMDIDTDFKDLVSEMFTMARDIIRHKGLEGKYRVSFNGGSLQIVPHLHMHVLGGELKRNYDN
jgi:histidine triad (HIT) family protein